MSATRRVLVIDDHEHVRTLLRIWLEEDARFDWAGEAADAVSGLRLVAEEQPEAVILDVHLPDGDGLSTLAELRRQHDGLQVVVYTNDDTVLDRALELGADAVFVKGHAVRDVMDALADTAGTDR